MEPARTIIKAFGGEKEVSRITGTRLTAPYRWQAPRSNGGTDGRIPQKPASKLLAYAKAHGIDVTADQFFGAGPEQTHAADLPPSLAIEIDASEEISS